jgi:ABC-2 type transport system permease protein
VFRSKIFTGFFTLCFAPALVYAILIYLRHNVTAMAILEIRVAELVPIDAYFFRVFVGIQCYLALLVAILVGPGLVSSDIANNALPLYLARPFSRAEYALGKMAAVLTLLSALTWVPGLLLYGFAAYLEGSSWFLDNVRIGFAIFVASWVWILLVTLLALAVSMLVRQAMVARGALVGLFFAFSAFAGIVNASFDTYWGDIVSLSAASEAVWISLFGDTTRVGLPATPAWLVIALVCAGCLALLARKIRAYEVVS